MSKGLEFFLGAQMFGIFKRAKIVAAATESISILIRTVEISGAVPFDTWTSPYVLGFINGTILNTMRQNGYSSRSPAEVSLLLANIYQSIFSRRAPEVANATEHFVRGNANYEKGRLAADKAFSISVGGKLDETDPLIIEARQLARIMPSGNPDADLGGALISLLFVGPAKIIAQELARNR